MARIRPTNDPLSPDFDPAARVRELIAEYLATPAGAPNTSPVWFISPARNDAAGPTNPDSGDNDGNED